MDRPVAKQRGSGKIRHKKRLDKIQKIVLIGGQKVGRTGGVDGRQACAEKGFLPVFTSIQRSL
jgi:hypothetical protein